MFFPDQCIRCIRSFRVPSMTFRVPWPTLVRWRKGKRWMAGPVLARPWSIPKFLGVQSFSKRFKTSVGWTTIVFKFYVVLFPNIFMGILLIISLNNYSKLVPTFLLMSFGILPYYEIYGDCPSPFCGRTPFPPVQIGTTLGLLNTAGWVVTCFQLVHTKKIFKQNDTVFFAYF